MKTCPYGGKVSYPSEHAAKEARIRRGHHVENLRIYKCPNCYKFHLSSHKRTWH